jgi:hypothetical protein
MACLIGRPGSVTYITDGAERRADSERRGKLVAWEEVNPLVGWGLAKMVLEGRLRRGPQDAPRDIQVPLAPSGSR